MDDQAVSDHEEAAPDPYVGKVLASRFRILRRVGTGGMGTVYEAEHELIGRRVALKLLHPQFAVNPGVVRRFMNEARAAGTLGHPHIVESLDVGRTDEGAPFLVLEFLEGVSLSDELERVGPFPLGRATRIVSQVASALSAAHERGIVHRDIKPDNVFLLNRHGMVDHVKLLDFGISKFEGGLTGATQTGAVMGTPYYMAPEQVQDASRADRRADVYALGAILYQLLTGQLPFEATSFPMLVVKILQEPPPPISAVRRDVPDALAAVVERAMQKEPEARFQTMAEMASALEPFTTMDGEPVLGPGAPVAQPVGSAPTPFTAESTSPTATLPTRRGGLLLLGGLALAVVLAGGGAAAFLMLRSVPSEASPLEPAAPVGAVAAPKGAEVPSAPEAVGEALPVGQEAPSAIEPFSDAGAETETAAASETAEMAAPSTESRSTSAERRRAAERLRALEGRARRRAASAMEATRSGSSTEPKRTVRRPARRTGPVIEEDPGF